MKKKIGYEMTSGEFFENRLFYMKYIGNYLNIERLLWMYSSHKFICMYIGVYKTPAHFFKCGMQILLWMFFFKVLVYGV